MSLASFQLRAERGNATRWAAAVLLLALAGSAALVAAQAARRTDTAFARNLAAGHASDAVVHANTFGATPAETRDLRAQGMKLLDAVHRSPLVVAHGRFGGVSLYRIRDGQVDQRLTTGSALGLVAFDNAMGRTLSAFRIYAGRLATPDRDNEILINQSLADVTGWRVGTRVTDLREFDMEDLDPETGGPRLDRGTHLSLLVVGIAELPEALLLARAAREARVYLTPAFAHRFPDSVFYLSESVRLRRGGADIPALRAAVSEVNRAAPAISMPIAPTADGLRIVKRANDPLVQGLWIIVALATLVGVMLVAQSLAQSFATRADDHAQLRALGATRRQRLSIELTILAVVALVAAVLAAVLGYLFSPLTPIGAARDAEPHPGFSLDVALTISAIALIFVGTMVAALPSLWRAVTAKALPGPVAIDPTERRSRVADLEARAGFGVTAVVGTRLAFQSGRGRSATPVRAVLASLTLVVAAVTATFAFGTNLQRLTTTPRLYGWNWDAAVGSEFGSIPRQFEQAVERFPHVVEASAMNIGVLTVAGRAIPAIGIDQLHGSVAPTIHAGRLPENAGELALGGKTMRELHAHIGGRIRGRIGSAHVELEVVGRTTFPSFGNERFAESGLGTGALGTASLLPLQDLSTPDSRYNYMLLRFAPGTAATTERRLRAWLAERGCADPSCLLTDSRPAEIDGYRNARGLPLAIGVVLVLFLVTTLVHVLVSTLRRRASDLAVLRALGCTPRQLGSTMRWQGLVLAASAVAIGLPCGLAASRLAWNAFASRLGIGPGTGVPLAALAVGAAGFLALTIAVASAVGWRAPAETRRHRIAAS